MLKGLCQKCFSSNVELILNGNSMLICDSCNQKKYDVNTEKAKLMFDQKKKELADLIKKHPELRGEMSRNGT